MKKWNLNSWKKLPAKHLPVYQEKEELDLVLSKIKKYPHLVFAGESRSLKKALSEVAEGKAFLLQGGDCAESFAEFHPDNIRDTFKVLLQLRDQLLVLQLPNLKDGTKLFGIILIPL